MGKVRPNEHDHLPVRLDRALARVLGTRDGVLQFRPDDAALPRLQCSLPQPAAGPLSLTIRIHSATGIPLASASADIQVGARSFETTRVSVMAMEAYAHLRADWRRDVERRVWSRRAFATASCRTGESC